MSTFAKKEHEWAEKALNGQNKELKRGTSDNALELSRPVGKERLVNIHSN